MPYLNVKISGQPSQEIVGKAINILTKHTAEILGKKTEVISVAIEYIPTNQWAIGGIELSSQGVRSFYLDIKITDGTNSKNEKAAFVQKIFSEFELLLGRLHPASYIVIHDVRADAWGYAGATQEYRYIQGKIPLCSQTASGEAAKKLEAVEI